MPIYEYSCAKCGETFEELIFGDIIPACPKCGNAKPKKMMSRPCRQSSSTDSDSSADDYAGGCGSASGCGSCSGGHCASCGH